MNRSFVLSAACAAALSLLAAAATAQTEGGLKPSKASATRHSLKAETKTPSPVSESVDITPAHIDVATRVLTGNAQCEFNQQVSVQPIAGQPAHFKVGFKNVTYTMVPELTTTGAVRLEDKKAGVVWVQIPAKSMLLNARAGQRMVDACQQKEQRTAAL